MSKDYVEDISESLNFLGIPWDEGPRGVGEFERAWTQVRRMGMYRDVLERLRESGKVFACDCTRSKILRESPEGVYPGTCREKGMSLDTEGCSWRVRTPASAKASAGKSAGEADLPLEMTDFVVRKKDGNPAYQLTSVVDDVYYGVDLVVRGDDLRASTAAQVWLAGELGLDEFRRIRFDHHPLLMASGEEKMSKSAGATSVRYLRRQGLKPAEIYSMILRQLGSDAGAGSWEELAEATGYLP
jgi:glutamyl-tRNA synthetase